MTIFRANTNLANQLFIPTRVWGGTSQTTFETNDPVQVANTFTVTGDDIILVTPQIGQHFGIAGGTTPGTGQTRAPDEVFTGTLNLSNSTIDLHNARITVTSVTRTATTTTITFEDSSNAATLASAFAQASGVRRLNFTSGGVTQFFITSTANIVPTSSGATVTYTTVGNTETGTLSFPLFIDRIFAFSNVDGSAPTAIGGANSVLGGVSSAIGGSSGTSFLWDNVRVLYSGRAYNFIGNFHARTAGLPTYTWNDVRLEGEVDTTTGTSFLNIFSGAVDNASTFNNVSFWNRETIASGDARGGTWQTTTNNVYNNTVVGPFGTQLEGVQTSRMIARFANQGRTDRSITNHAGLSSNYDMRSLGQVQASNLTNLTGNVLPTNLNWFIDVDTGGRMYFLNWLPGRPNTDAINNFTFSNIFNAGSGPTRGGRAHVCVGINQNFNANGITDVNHTVTFSDATLNRSPTSATDSNNVRGVFFLPGAWDVNTPPVYRTGRVHANPGPIVFEVQDADFTNRDLAGGADPLVNRYDIRPLVSPSFRKYSWRQQPDNTTWGREITVAVPADNASDADVATAREGGYDIYDGSTWTTSTSLVDPVDPYITLLGSQFDTPALARAQITGVGTVDQGTRIVGAIKERCYTQLSATGASAVVNANNTRFALPYAFNNQVFNSGVRTILNGAATQANIVTSIAGEVNNMTLPVGANGIAPDSLITGLNCAGVNILEITNNALSTTTTANQAFTYEANIIDFDNGARLGNFTARALTEGFHNFPATIPAGMTMNGRMSFGPTGVGRSTLRTITFDRATDTSGITLENFHTNVNIVVVGKQASEFQGTNTPNGGTFTFQGVQPITFPRAGSYFVGRIRSGVYTPITTNVARCSAGQVVELSGAVFESTDTVRVYYKPDDGNVVSNDERYDLTQTEFAFSNTAMNISAERIAPQLILGVGGEFAPVGTTETIRRYNSEAGNANGGIDIEVNVGVDLDLQNTKRFFIWVQNLPEYLDIIRRNGYPANSIDFTTRGISVNANALSISRPAAAAQHDVTGLTATGTVTSGAAVSLNAASDTADPFRYVIATTSGVRDFVNQVVAQGITTSEVISAVEAAPIFGTLDTNVRAMRTNRLLGIRPQGINSGGDFTV